MARMIPPQIAHDCRSPGEKILFSRFKQDPDTRNWIILHSLGVAKHPKRCQGEIDFVILVPKEGVLCVEVKAGNVVREEGIWKYGSGAFSEKSVVGPFRQASEAMHAIKKYVSRTAPSLQRILFFSGVFFTFIDFHEVSPEWESWQYAGRSRLARLPVSVCCSDILRRAHLHIQNTPAAKWYNAFQSRPTEEQVNQLAELLRGDFEYYVSPRINIEETEREIHQFTEEQFTALDVLEENSRILYKGPAGTGKTFLAIEAARRSTRAGKSTLLVCYNRLLGQWLKRQTESLNVANPGLLTVGTMHSILLRLSGLSPSNDKAPIFWSRILPEAVVERALSGVIRIPLYDMLIIDEAQDLVTEEYLDVLDLLLDGGFAGGQWGMFGDFERQAIYAPKQVEGKIDVPLAVKTRAPVYFSYPLRINCRNTEQIAAGLELACGLQPEYSRILCTGYGSDIATEFYATQDEQANLLRRHLVKLQESFSPPEITILSSRDDQSSCAGLVSGSDSSLRLRPNRDEERDDSHTGFGSIHAFKGLEAPTIILTDINDIGGEKAQALLYVGMSRARQRLVMFMHEKCRIDYMNALRESYRTPKSKGKF